MTKPLTITWRRTRPKFGPVYPVGYVGKLRLFTITDSMTRDCNEKYLRCKLPGAPSEVTVHSEEEGKSRAAEFLRAWMEQLEAD